MKSAAHIKGHPLHPMLIVVPAGAFIITLVLDVVYLLGGGLIWWQATIPVMIVGVVGALIAALPGLIDLFKVAEPQGAFRIGVIHGILNLVVVTIFTVNFVVRLAADTTEAAIPWPFWLSVVGVGLLAVSGSLGWHMVYRYRVGVVEEPWEGAPEREREPPEEPGIREAGTPA